MIQNKTNKTFTFKPLNLKTYNRHHVDEIRYYDIVEENQEPLKMVSITSITSNYKKEFFANWRKESVLKLQIVYVNWQQVVERILILLLSTI